MNSNRKDLVDAGSATVMLIVENHVPMRRLLTNFLQAAHPGTHIVEAADGAGAMAACAAQRPAVVLMDIGLPDANGIALTARIKDQFPDCAVIIVSQHAGSPYVERAQAAGAVAYVTKDRVHAELLPVVAKALALQTCVLTGTPGASDA